MILSSIGNSFHTRLARQAFGKCCSTGNCKNDNNKSYLEPENEIIQINIMEMNDLKQLAIESSSEPYIDYTELTRNLEKAKDSSNITDHKKVLGELLNAALNPENILAMGNSSTDMLFRIMVNNISDTLGHIEKLADPNSEDAKIAHNRKGQIDLMLFKKIPF